MIRAARAWLRVVSPPGWIVALYVGLCLCLVAVEYGLPWWLDVPAAGEPFGGMRGGLAVAGSIAYALYRVFAFHPLHRSAYASWLALTPWRSRQPLPLGPVHLVWQDAVALALLSALRYGTPVPLWAVPSALGIVYLGAICVTVFVAGLSGWGYALAFGLGLVVRLGPYLWAAIGAALLLYLCARFAIGRSLEGFPWQIPEWWSQAQTALGKPRERVRTTLGWPFDTVRPDPPAMGISHYHATMLSLLVAWWVYALLSISTDRDKYAPFFMLYAILCGGCIFGRTILYCEHHWPPISLWGRIRTLRWIIPGYDQVFLAPLCTLLVSVAGPLGLYALGLPPEVALAAGFFLVLFVTLAMGPSREQWLLTGSHRIVSGLTRLSKQEFVEL